LLVVPEQGMNVLLGSHVYHEETPFFDISEQRFSISSAIMTSYFLGREAFAPRTVWKLQDVEGVHICPG
jgi:hypothetical protein